MTAPGCRTTKHVRGKEPVIKPCVVCYAPMKLVGKQYECAKHGAVK